MEPIIELQHVYFTYDELPEAEEGKPVDLSNYEHLAIRNLSLSIEPGSCVAILGHNGSGKSTLAKLCNGILAPDQGDVLVAGINTRDEENLMEIRQHVGMVFQNPDNQIVASVVEEDVAFGPENLGVPPEEIRQRVDAALKAVNMYDYRNHAPHKLSGGQKQRVAIAGILAMETECVVFDESTAMLDPRGRREVMDSIHKLHDDMGKTVVYITHYMDEAVKADRVIVMDHGQIIADGTPYEVFSNTEQLRSVGLDIPNATEFAGLLREDGFSIPDHILTTTECVDAICTALNE